MADRRTFAILIGALAATLVLCVVGVIVLIALERPVDDILKQAITGLITGLLGLFARTPASGESTPVHVVNSTEDAVPVEPT